MSPGTVAFLTRLAFVLLGAAFLIIAVLALFVRDLSDYPLWLAGPVGVLVFLILLGVSLLAPRRSQAIYWDEVTQHAWLRAQAFGYWTGVFGFAIFGNLVSAGLLPLQNAFVCGAMLAAAAPFLRFLAGEWQSRA